MASRVLPVREPFPRPGTRTEGTFDGRRSPWTRGPVSMGALPYSSQGSQSGANVALVLAADDLTPLRNPTHGSWLEGQTTLFAGGCNEDRRLSGIWHALLDYDDG